MTAGPLLLSINSAWNIVNFRPGLIRGLQEAGFEVVCAAPPDEHVPRIEALGCRFLPLPMDSKGVSPLADAALFGRYVALMRAVRPAAFLGFTIKPNVYGSLAARLLGIPVVNNISGLGTAFIRDTLLTRLVETLYRTALAGSATVFFQNRDDQALFAERRLAPTGRSALLPGSGVDLARFAPRPAPARAAPVFLLLARLLWDKGVGEFVEAARRLRAEGVEARFRLLGFLDVANRTAVQREAVEGWVAEGLIEYPGATDDVRPFIADADCIVLPSYREGAPRALLEAAAMARPLIASDAPGCRDAVDDGVSGFLCAPRDAASLAARMLDFIALPPEARRAMGEAGRRKMQAEYDERVVVDRYLAALRAVDL